jgi:hypothetical protein
MSTAGFPGYRSRKMPLAPKGEVFGGKCVARKTKLGTPRGVREWEQLETIADIKRMLRWAVVSLREQSMDRHDAMAFGTLANILIRACEGADIERRLADLESRYDTLMQTKD